MRSLDVNRPDFADTLKSCDWFCAERHPEARFESKGRTRQSDNRLIFRGDLLFRGVTRPAEPSFKRSDFGLDKYIPAVGDQVAIEVYAEFVRR